LPASRSEVTAVRLSQKVGTNGFPLESEWERATYIRFSHDWQGRTEDLRRQTEVRILWSELELHVRFLCRYRAIHVFPDAEPNGRRDGLWDRDVAEVFLQPDRFGEKYYKEFEVSPNGQWLDLDITPQGLTHITSGMRTLVTLDEANREWTSYLAIPIDAIASPFDPATHWRANFFRCEGVDPQRFYGAWQPTSTPTPDFHVPGVFGTLRFVE
jgi:Carbohydrate-binding family 9